MHGLVCCLRTSNSFPVGISAMSENVGHWKWKWRSVTMFLSLFLLHGFAVLLFTRGFLLTRSELSEYSQCGDVYQSPCFTPPKNDNQTKAGSCWTKPAVERLVIIVLDALRFDFAAPSTFFPEKKPWMDKLQILHKVASQNQSSSRIFKAIADPPTTSLQRLKGLTTGGLPTFIDVGNSFGAPAIVEDNLIHQLVQNGKRVVMMGDDTWTQLFPHHFIKSYPFPSFNVKDLDTVDNGCIENLFPALHEEDWDVLIAHFLGVDHAGHIFGVESTKMTDKLEQYNDIIEKVIGVLESQCGPGGLHENTMLLVMGDHGQTLNGDHGGGTAEEVETTIFALSLNKPPPTTHAEIDSLSCKYDTHGRNICISSIQQLDFAVTVSALLGLPFPFGSIGRVNVDLYSLAGGTWNMENSAEDEGHASSKFRSWMQNYVNVLCINSWQVKKYIDVYSSLSLIGFSEKDLLHVRELYSKAEELWSITLKNFFLIKNENASASLTSLRRQLDAYSIFLQRVASLARSSWTEFDLKLMGMGLCILLGSLFLHAFFILKLEKLSGCHSSSSVYSWKSIRVIFAILVVLVRAFSFLSNSYILEEGRVASFLLATTGMLQLRHAIIKRARLLEALVICLLVLLLRISIEFGQLKQAVNSLFLKVDPTQILGIGSDSQYLAYTAEALPLLAIIIEARFLYKSAYSRSSWGIAKCVITGAFFTYLLIPLYWASHSGLLSPHLLFGSENGNIIPRAIYATGLVQLSLLALDWLIARRDRFNMEEITVTKALALLSAWSSPIMILSGKHGPLFVLGFVIGGFCLIRLMALEGDPKNDGFGSSFSYALPVIQWSLLAVCFFFGTGHWCTFDGLRYASAFVGFDEFNIVRQAILLTIETFGFSHIIPIFGLSLLIACSRYPLMQNKQIFSLRLSQAYLMYGLVTSLTTTFTMLCVTIQRRHLMVWGLFAPKFVFDVVGLLLGDLLILLSSLYFIV